MQRDRKLFAALQWPPARLAALHVARFFPKRLLADRRRIACHHPADRRDVRRRPFPQNVLVEYGFRLPSALDNRPLNFQEFMGMTNQILYISATPAEFELHNTMVGNTNYIPHSRASDRQGGDRTDSGPDAHRSLGCRFRRTYSRLPMVAQQIIRPTGLWTRKLQSVR